MKHVNTTRDFFKLNQSYKFPRIPIVNIAGGLLPSADRPRKTLLFVVVLAADSFRPIYLC